MSRFTDHLGLELVEDFRGRAVLRDGRCLWRVTRALIYDVGDVGSGEVIVVPVGFVTDLASIPLAARGLLPPDGPWAKAAVVHDHLYKTKGIGGLYTRGRCDAIFREAMGVVGVPAWKRNVLWAAVRLGGGGGWGT